ncbi:MAG: hypothetical protein AAFQ82_16495 [Myxococcota bacterium]
MLVFVACAVLTADAPLTVSVSYLGKKPEPQESTVLRSALTRELALAGLIVVPADEEGVRLSIELDGVKSVLMRDDSGAKIGGFPSPNAPAEAMGLALQIAERVYAFLGIPRRPPPEPEPPPPPRPKLAVVPVPAPPIFAPPSRWSAALLGGVAFQPEDGFTVEVQGEVLRALSPIAELGLRVSGTPLSQQVGSESEATARVRRGAISLVARLRLLDTVPTLRGFLTLGGSYLRGRGESAPNGLQAPTSDSQLSAAVGGGLSLALPLNQSTSARFEISARYSIPSPEAFSDGAPLRLDAPVLGAAFGLHFY